MFIALDKEGNKIEINGSQKKKKYFCPCCGAEVIQKKGKVNIWHYSHKNIKECDLWYEMTEWHRSWQEHFPDEFREVIMDNGQDKHIADIKVKNLVVEFQHSPMSVDTFKERCEFYGKDGYLIWLFDLRDKKIYETGWSGCRKYQWDWAHKFIQGSIKNFKNVDIFFQIKNYFHPEKCRIVKVIDNKKGLKYFDGVEFSENEFMDYLRLIYVKTKNEVKVSEIEKDNWIAIHKKKRRIKENEEYELCREGDKLFDELYRELYGKEEGKEEEMFEKFYKIEEDKKEKEMIYKELDKTEKGRKIKKLYEDIINIEEKRKNIDL